MLPVLEARKKDLQKKLIERAGDILEELSRIDKLIETERTKYARVQQEELRRRESQLMADQTEFKRMSNERIEALKRYNPLTSDASRFYDQIRNLTEKMKLLGGKIGANPYIDEVFIDKLILNYVNPGKYNSMTCTPEMREEWAKYYKPDIINSIEMDVNFFRQLKIIVIYKELSASNNNLSLMSTNSPGW